MKPKILLVDDEQYFYDLFAFAFTKEYDITYFNSTKGIEEEVIKNKYDLFITDLNLNPSEVDLTGLDLIKKLKGKYPKIPCIAVTSVKRSFLPKRAFDVGADEYLHKDNFNIKSWKNVSMIY